MGQGFWKEATIAWAACRPAEAGLGGGARQGRKYALLQQSFAVLSESAPRKEDHIMIKKWLAVCVLLGLGACAVYTPHGSVVVDPDRPHGNGSFCPPGQAKKGNC